MRLPVGSAPVLQRLHVHLHRQRNLVPFHRIECRVAKEETGIIIVRLADLVMGLVVDVGDTIFQRFVEMAVDNGEVRVLEAESGFPDAEHFAPYRCQMQFQLKTRGIIGRESNRFGVGQN